MKHTSAIAVLCLGMAACGPHSTSLDMAACIPPGNIAIASADLDRLRAAPVYAKLPPAASAFAESYRDAHRLMAAWNGNDVLMVFRGGAPGATPIGPNLVAVGSAASVQAAQTQYRTGKTGVPDLIDAALKAGAASPVWAIVRGNVTLPLSGNWRNVNRLLRNLDYLAIAIDASAAIDLRLTGQAKDEASARDFEQTLRALVSLASVAESRNAQISGVLNSLQIRRTGVVTIATLHVPADAVSGIAAPLGR